jgi:hypothetical protein
MPLEALWWADDMSAYAREDRAAWKWTAMVAQPPGVTTEDIATAVADVRRRKPRLTVLDDLRLVRWAEGPCAQLMHIGPYKSEGPNIERLHAFIAEKGAKLAGKHHEIYLSDARRTAPERLKTIIRQPLVPKGN